MATGSVARGLGGTDVGAGPRHDAYDVVVIGAGVGGLTAGALLARAGKSVLVVEAERQPGGHARAMRDGPYTFDRADHLIMGCERQGAFGPGIVDELLRHLDVRDRCDFVRVDAPVFEARFPDFRIAVPYGRAAFLEAHARHFPDEVAGLERLAELSASIYREWLSFPLQPRMRDLLTAPWRSPGLFRYRNATLARLMDRELRDPRLKSVYAALSAWLALPPSRLSFLMWSIMIAAYIEEGAYYCRGSFQTLADALAEGLARADGELLLGTRVTRIVAPHRKVQAVELEGGQRVSTPQVISNIDPRETLGGLLASERVPKRYLRRLREGTLSESCSVMYLATDLDVHALGARFDTSCLSEWDLERMYERSWAGELSYVDVLIPTVVDPGLAPPGEHIVILQAGVPHVPTTDERVGEQMLALAEHVLPGLRDHVTHAVPAATGRTERFPVHRIDAIYGWEASPQHTGLNRLPQRTPIGGLLLAGQWTQPGLGVLTVAASGIEAARLVLRAPAARPPLPIGIPTASKARAATR